MVLSDQSQFRFAAVSLNIFFLEAHLAMHTALSQTHMIAWMSAVLLVLTAFAACTIESLAVSDLILAIQNLAAPVVIILHHCYTTRKEQRRENLNQEKAAPPT